MSQSAEFQERLKRIDQGEQYVAEYLIPKDLRRARKIERQRIIRMGAVLSFLLLFFVGMVSVFLIRYGRFQVFGIDRADLTTLEGLIMDGGGSMLMVVTVMVTTKLNSWIMMLSQVAGAAASFLGMHWAVHRFPEFFADIFSLQWLYMVLRSTDPEMLLKMTF